MKIYYTKALFEDGRTEICRYSLDPNSFKDNPIDDCLGYEELIDDIWFIDIQDITKPFPGDPYNGRVLYDIGHISNGEFISEISLESPVVSRYANYHNGKITNFDIVE